MRKKFLSWFMTVLVVGILLYSAPARAITVGIDDVSDETPGEREDITFRAIIDLHADDAIPLEQVHVDIKEDDSVVNTCVFDLAGNKLSDCTDINISLLRSQVTTALGYGYGYGYGDEGYGPSLGYFDFGYGYGYGYSYGYGADAYSNEITSGELEYEITYTTPFVDEETTYAIEVRAETSTGVQFKSTTSGSITVQDTDTDNDNIPDSIDSIIGKEVDSTVDLDITIGGDDNLTKQFTGTKTIALNEGNQTRVSFDWDFDANPLVLNFTITEEEGKILVQGLDLSGVTKTVWVEKTGTNGACIIDETNASLSFTDDCNGANEVQISCPGSSGDYACDEDGAYWKISGLSHSAVESYTIPSSPNSGSGSSGGSGSSSSDTTQVNFIGTGDGVSEQQELQDEETPVATSEPSETEEEAPEANLLTGQVVGEGEERNPLLGVIVLLVLAGAGFLFYRKFK